MDTLESAAQRLPQELPHIAQVQFYPSVESTNEAGLTLGKAGAPGGTLILADQQTAGRGRLGRLWESPAGKGLYLSLIERPPIPPARAPLLTLVAGLALKRSLSSFQLPEMLLKWPNDCWIRGKKLAGILTEMNTDGKKLNFVVVGVGLNIYQQASDFSAELQKIAGSLKDFIPPSDLDRVTLLKKFLTAWRLELELFLQEGAAPLMDRWEKQSGMIGKKVRTGGNQEEVSGTAVGLNEEGHLQIKSASGKVHSIIAGDIFLEN